MVKTAIWVVVGSLFVIAFTFFAFMDMENQLENHHKGIISKVEIQRDSVQKLLDSLSDETLRLNIDIGRYEVALNILEIRNPEAAKEFSKILSQETE